MKTDVFTIVVVIGILIFLLSCINASTQNNVGEGFHVQQTSPFDLTYCSSNCPDPAFQHDNIPDSDSANFNGFVCLQTNNDELIIGLTINDAGNSLKFTDLSRKQYTITPHNVKKYKIGNTIKTSDDGC